LHNKISKQILNLPFTVRVDQEEWKQNLWPSHAMATRTLSAIDDTNFGVIPRRYRACSAGHVLAGFGLFQLIFSHITLFNQLKSAEILPAELDHTIEQGHVHTDRGFANNSAIKKRRGLISGRSFATRNSVGENLSPYLCA
jgi:hypothetical protein